MEYKKIDNSIIEVTKTIPEIKKVSKYSYDFLLEQKKQIQLQKDKYDEERDTELAEVDAHIAECEKLGLVKKPIIVNDVY